MTKNKIEVGENSEEIMRFLEDKIYEHNSSTINKSDAAFFSRIVRDENEHIIAGIAGWTWATACEITQLWVDENARKNGIGKLLLEAAEAEAKSKGCLTIVVKAIAFRLRIFTKSMDLK